MSILDRKFRYTPSHVHLANPNYLRDKFRRMISEQSKQAEADKAEASKKVTKLKGAK
tara:strand:- start:1954 stop:2124 length:171 start_codon:yes stop_codon:yes gene_type:complete